MSALLQLEAISCRHDSVNILSGIDLHVNEHDICCLLGPSGCGKTTLLRAIAGFHPITTGSISLGNGLLSTPAFLLPPEEREVGMVFQDYALFPHLTVAENIRFGLHQLTRADRQQTLDAMLQLVGLQNQRKRYPHELSGGQRQRVALARALARKPRLLLLDEPFSNLDTDLRQSLSLEVHQILKQQGISAIMVTHDQQEAFAFADHVGVLNEGSLIQWDTPYNLFHEPNSRFVASFIGRGCFLEGRARSVSVIETELGILSGNRAYPIAAGSHVEILLRPDDIILALPDEPAVAATVVHRVFSGSTTLHTLQLPSGARVEAQLPSHHEFTVNQRISIRAEVEHLVLFTLDQR